MSTQTAAPMSGLATAGRAAPGAAHDGAIPVKAQPILYIHAPTHTAPDVPTVPRGDSAPIVQDPRLDQASGRLARLTVRVGEAARLARAGYSPYTITTSRHEEATGRQARWRTTLAALGRRAGALWRGIVPAGARDGWGRGAHAAHSERRQGPRHDGVPTA